MMARIINDRESFNLDGIRFTALTGKSLALLTRDDFFKKNKDPNYEPVYHAFPASVHGTLYIVSNMVLDASDRYDLIAPDIDQPVLDRDGKIIGYTGYLVNNLDLFLYYNHYSEGETNGVRDEN